LVFPAVLPPHLSAGGPFLFTEEPHKNLFLSLLRT